MKRTIFSGTEFAKYCIVLRKLMCNVEEFWKYFPEEKCLEILPEHRGLEIVPIRTLITDEICNSTILNSLKRKNNYVYLSNDDTCIFSLTYAAFDESYDVYDSEFNLEYNEHIPIIKEQLPEEYWFQQSTVQDEKELFCAEFYNTLHLHDSLCMFVTLPLMDDFILKYQDTFDELVEKL